MSDRLYDIESLLEEVVTLPSMPTTLARISQMIEDPECSMQQVSQIIAADPSIAMKCMRIVNSAYYGLGNEVNTLEHAVVLLGAKVIKNLVLTATVFDRMSGSAGRFLRHSAACGLAMRCLAEVGPLQRFIAFSEEAFIYGLLHDIGQVILEEFIPEECAEVTARMREEKLPRYRAERAIIGVDHAELGGRLAEQWKLQPPMVNAIGHHHDLTDCPEDFKLLAANLTVADYICSASGLPSHEHTHFDIPDEVWRASGIHSDMLPRVTARFFEVKPMVEEFMAMAK